MKHLLGFVVFLLITVHPAEVPEQPVPSSGAAEIPPLFAVKDLTRFLVIADRWVTGLPDRIGPEHEIILREFWDRGRRAYWHGAYPEARRLLEKQVEISERLLGHENPYTMVAVNDLALVLLAQGDLSGARGHLERAVEGLRREYGDEHRETLNSLNNLALVLQAQGHLSAARQRFERLLDLRTQVLSADHPYTLIAASLLAETLLGLGDLAGARALLEQVVVDLGQVLGPEHLVTLAAEKHLAVTLLQQGEPKKAREYLEHVIQHRQRRFGLGHPQTLSALNNLAQTHLAEGNLITARGLLEDVVKIWAGIPEPGDTEVLTALNNLALTIEDLCAARPLFELMEKVSVRILGLEHPHTLLVRQNLASILMDTHHFSDARQRWEAIVDFIARRRAANSEYFSYAEVPSLFGLGHLYQSLGEPERAYATFLMGLDALERQIENVDRTEDVKSRFRLQKQGAYQAAIDAALALGYHDEAFQILERYRARSQLALRARNLSWSSDMDSEHRNLVVRYNRHCRSNLGSTAKSTECDLWLRQIEERGMEEIHLARAPLDAHAARESLDSGTVMLAYSFTDWGVHLFVLSRDEPLKVLAIEATAEELMARITSFSLSVQKFGDTYEETIRDDSENRLDQALWLFETLIAPAFVEIDAERLLILPDGPLHFVPFGALARRAENGPGWQYLVEWKPFHTVQSATIYAEIRERRKDDATPTSLIVVANPQPPLNGLEPLPQTETEVEAIRCHFQGKVEAFVGTEATEEKVKAAVHGASNLHFAVHAFANDEEHRQSFLALGASGAENGVLEAWEIIHHLRLEAELVVLSACVTAMGPARGGEGLLSLGRAFQIAGARSVVASLWPVADDSTAELMARFYDYLSLDMPKDEALRAAQLDLIRGPIELRDGEGKRDFTDPFYWAAFQLNGDWR